MVAFTWTITTVLTFFAFITAVILTIQVHTHYRRLRNYYEGDDWYQNDNNNYYNNNEGEGQEDQPSHDQQYEQIRESYELLSSMSARSITFVAVYTMMLATALSLYGSMAIVGFTSLRGVYIAPCFSSGGNKLRVGIFGGSIVIFANLLLVCAVVLGEVKVRGGMMTRA
jgi:predicted PurR-regulated permease PerM